MTPNMPYGCCRIFLIIREHVGKVGEHVGVMWGTLRRNDGVLWGVITVLVMGDG